MMTIAYWCILAVILLPYVFGPIGQLPGLTYEQFKTPRARQPSLTGWHARANAAHMNGLEIVAGFAASVIVAQTLKAPQTTIDILAMTFVGTRLLHGAFYIANLAIPRTMAWALGVICIIALFVQAA